MNTCYSYMYMYIACYMYMLHVDSVYVPFFIFVFICLGYRNWKMKLVSISRIYLIRYMYICYLKERKKERKKERQTPETMEK